MNITQILYIALASLVFIIIVLLIIYAYISIKNKNAKTETEKDKNLKQNNETEVKSKATLQYTKIPVFDFMEFDKIEDDMIVQNNGAKYLMIIECQGINYDLMSEVEKSAVEQGFIQFLNILRHPIQIYTQTRTINIGDSIETYNKRVDDIKAELQQKQNQYNKLLQAREYDKKELDKLKLEMVRQQNLYDYGKDIIINIEKMSNNKNVLKKYYYIVVPYYAEEIGNDILDPEEKKSMIFSELYTRAEALIRTLFACSMKCKVMDSNELAELLYVAYNRDEAEVYGIEKALKAGYNELYSTAPDVLDKKIMALNKAIEDRALEMAKDMIDETKNEKQKTIENKEDNFEEIVKEMAVMILKDNKQYVGEEVAQKAIDKIKKQKTNEKGGDKNDKISKKETTGRTTK